MGKRRLGLIAACVMLSTGWALADCALPPSSAGLESRLEHTGSNGLAAVVGDDVVTNHDLAQRVALRLWLTGIDPSPRMLERIERADLQNLKSEKVLLSEAKRRDIVVSPAEVDSELRKILAEGSLSMSQLQRALFRSGVEMSTLRSQIAVDVARAKLTGKAMKLGYRVSPDRCNR